LSFLLHDRVKNNSNRFKNNKPGMRRGQKLNRGCQKRKEEKLSPIKK
jgi:hypothetical protein